MRKQTKFFLNLVCQILTLPMSFLCKLEELFFKNHSEVIFHFCGDSLALFPGLPGVFIRRAFYSQTLEHCSLNSHIGFGSIFSHRATRVSDHVYIGSYSIIGSCDLGEHCLIGSRVSILSGKALHVIGDEGMWTPYSHERINKITIHKNVWIGEGAIIVADIGEGSMVGAGSVVTSDIKSQIIVTGNPARFVKKLVDE